MVVTLTRPKYSAPDTSDWHTGDVFFSVGDSWKSVAVRSISGALNLQVNDTLPSHCGFVVREGNDVYLVHESTDAGTIAKETPEEYVRKNGTYCLYIMRPPMEIDTLRLMSTLEDMRRRQIPFDFGWDHDDSSELYCTEFVILAYARSGYPFLTPLLRKSTYIYPQDIADRLRHP